MLESVLILDPPDDGVGDLAAAFELTLSKSQVEIVTTIDHLTDRLRGGMGRVMVLLHGERGDGKHSGIDLIAPIRDVSPDVPIVIVADRGDVDSAADAIRAGANDFLVRGPQLPARVATLLGKMHALVDVIDRARHLDDQNAQLQDSIQAQCRIIGESPQVRHMIARIRALAPIPRPVLIVGERGTGKEMVARAIHFAAPHTSRTIVAVNCASFSDALLESELFGHERGAFTGADEMRHGKFAQADGGTLFLDEIGHMSLPFQRKILRVVEYGTFTRVGGHQELTTTARIVAATNVDLPERIRRGEFLADLYDRLTFDVLDVPPLREREGDVEVLARHFLDQFAFEIPDFSGKTLSRAGLRCLQHYAFPGNIRELKNVIERAACRDTTQEITPQDLGLPSNASIGPRTGTFLQRVEAFRRELLEEALSQAEGNQAEAARRLGLSYHQFRYHYGRLRTLA